MASSREQEDDLIRRMPEIRRQLCQNLSDSMIVRWHYGDGATDPFAVGMLDRIRSGTLTKEDRKWLDAMEPRFDDDN